MMDVEKPSDMGSKSCGDAGWKLQVIDDEDVPVPQDHFPLGK
jgi:hypothetical protein